MRLLSELDQLDDHIVGEVIAADADAMTPDRDPTEPDHRRIIEPTERFLDKHER